MIAPDRQQMVQPMQIEGRAEPARTITASRTSSTALGHLYSSAIRNSTVQTARCELVAAMQETVFVCL